MFLELIALAAASDASSNAANAKKLALSLGNSGVIPTFIKLTDHEVGLEPTGYFSSKSILRPKEEVTLNISNIKGLSEGSDRDVKYTVVRTFDGHMYYSDKTQDELKAMILTEIQNLVTLFKG